MPSDTTPGASAEEISEKIVLEWIDAWEHQSLSGLLSLQEDVAAAITRDREARGGGAVAEGWQLVPKEPTPWMLEAGLHTATIIGFSRDTVRQCWANMLANAPPPPAGAGEWRDIASAPKDGTLIIVPGGVAHWRDGRWYTATFEPYPGRPIAWPVTVWMPLPPDPSADAAPGDRGEPDATGDRT